MVERIYRDLAASMTGATERIGLVVGDDDVEADVVLLQLDDPPSVTMTSGSRCEGLCTRRAVQLPAKDEELLHLLGVRGALDLILDGEGRSRMWVFRTRTLDLR